MDANLEEQQELARLEKAAKTAEATAATPQEIKREAAQPEVAPHVQVQVTPRDRTRFQIYLLVLLGFGAVVAGLYWKPDLVSSDTAEKLLRYLTGGAGITFLLLVAKLVEIYTIGRLRNAVTRYNMRRILRLAVGLFAAMIVISVLFVNWYAAVVSLGLISLILGFALQVPISSFIGWIFILVRQPYRVGDRIEIGELRGDVIDVSYLDTTLWEIGGRHLSTDHPSGRLIKFPNTNVFQTPVINYSWPLFPYVWNEIRFSIAYESDLDFVAQTMQKIAEEEIGASMMDKVRLYRDLLAKTPVDHLEVKERPVVLFRVNENTWLEAIVRYLVPPKEAGRVKSAMLRRMLKALNAAPDRVLFPKSNMR